MTCWLCNWHRNQKFLRKLQQPKGTSGTIGTKTLLTPQVKNFTSIAFLTTEGEFPPPHRPLPINLKNETQHRKKELRLSYFLWTNIQPQKIKTCCGGDRHRFTKTSAVKRHIRKKHVRPTKNWQISPKTDKKSFKGFNVEPQNQCFLPQNFPLAAGLPVTSEVSRCKLSRSFFLGF